MSQSRIDIIKKAFQKMDRTGDGHVTMEDLKDVYNYKEHPKFKSGEFTKAQVQIYLYSVGRSVGQSVSQLVLYFQSELCLFFCLFLCAIFLFYIDFI
jgi:hypothetical protein